MVAVGCLADHLSQWREMTRSGARSAPLRALSAAFAYTDPMPTSPAPPPAHLAANLQLLCSFKSSIAEAARALGVNRSQFNKYLAGSSQPRPALLRRIGDHFGLEVHELLMPTEDFAALLEVRRRPASGRHAALHASVDALLDAADPRGQALVGRYFEHYQSMSTPGFILRALVDFEWRDRVIYYRRIERIVRPGARCRRHFVYHGVALMLGDRIILTDRESRLGIEATQTILYPDFTRSQASLIGIKLGIAANRSRSPCAARVLLERTPAGAGFIECLRQCGLFEPGSGAVAPRIVSAVDNRSCGPHHFLSASLDDPLVRA